MVEKGFRSFGRIAVSPEACGQAPSNLYGLIRKYARQVRMGEAAEPHRFGGLLEYDGIKAQAVLRQHAVQPSEDGIRLLIGSAEWKKFHDFRIGVDFTEKVTISGQPRPEQETGRLNDGGPLGHGVTKSLLR